MVLTGLKKSVNEMLEETESNDKWILLNRLPSALTFPLSIAIFFHTRLGGFQIIPLVLVCVWVQTYIIAGHHTIMKPHFSIDDLHDLRNLAAC